MRTHVKKPKKKKRKLQPSSENRVMNTMNTMVNVNMSSVLTAELNGLRYAARSPARSRTVIQQQPPYRGATTPLSPRRSSGNAAIPNINTPTTGNKVRTDSMRSVHGNMPPAQVTPRVTGGTPQVVVRNPPSFSIQEQPLKKRRLSTRRVAFALN